MVEHGLRVFLVGEVAAVLVSDLREGQLDRRDQGQPGDDADQAEDTTK
ncbi:MAG TPA: hypothetical protein VGH57_37105 [Amycolatopsis sp.]